MNEQTKPEIILLHQTLVESLLSDLATFLMIIGVIGTGCLLHSVAMQWCGFAMLILSALVKPWKKRRTPQEAADYLQEKYGANANCRQGEA